MDPAAKSLSEQTILITGAGSGIGRGIAQRCAAAGARLALVGRRRDALQETAAGLDGAQVEVASLDVTDAAAVQRVFADLAEKLGGRLDALVNNAGMGGPNACTGEGPENWDAILRTNLDGVFHCSREACKLMPDGGRVINVSSVLGRFGVPGYTAYCASKAGVIGFTRALALELAPRQITVNAICPGWVDTEMAHEGIRGLAAVRGVEYQQAFDDAMALVPMGRIIQPEEIGELVVYLCSPAAAAMTGQAVSLCGGSTMV